MKNIILSVALFATTIISGCDKSPSIASIKSQLDNQIKIDLPQLAIMDAVYLTEFDNYQHNKVWSDNLYIRKDVVSRSYGFKLDDVINSINIFDKNGKRYLTITIPSPNRLLGADNNENILALSKNSTYKPVDQQGNTIDISREMNKTLDEQEQNLQPLLINEAKDKARVYFKLLAKKLDLELDDSDITFK